MRRKGQPVLVHIMDGVVVPCDLGCLVTGQLQSELRVTAVWSLIKVTSPGDRCRSERSDRAAIPNGSLHVYIQISRMRPIQD